MSKKKTENVEKHINAKEEQAVDLTENLATEVVQETAQEAAEAEVQAEVENVAKTEPEAKIEKKTEKKGAGSALALLALLVALGIGGAGYLVGSQKFAQYDQAIKNLSGKIDAVQTAAPAAEVVTTSVDIPSFEAEKAQLNELSQQHQSLLTQLKDLEQKVSLGATEISALQQDVLKLSNVSGNDNSAWLLSDAQFLLNNALKKLSIDSDVKTAQKLLQESDSVLAKLSGVNVEPVRKALQADLSTLANLNEVDQNELTGEIAKLIGLLEDFPAVVNESSAEESASNEVSDSLDEWQQNLEKSASSFLDHFIRVSDRSKANEKAFIAPNQEIYLRQNIRLNLQIAMLAVSRQQNELYRQSLDKVASWVRSYFDVNHDSVKTFLKGLDELSEKSVYIDAPESLESLEKLKELLNAPHKSLDAKDVPVEAPKAEENAPSAEKAAE